MIKFIVCLGLIPWLYSCNNPNLSLKDEGLKVNNVTSLVNVGFGLPHEATTYIPIYSEIHMEHNTRKLGLTVTISIRNKNFKDTIYIKAVDRYNALGKKAQNYQKEIMLLAPLQSTAYVIEDSDIEREIEGSIVVNWGATSSETNPLIQAVMISTLGPHGISFVTEGVSIETETTR